ncbi:Reduced folate carrier,Major facilitator superfamily domain [Cinara cedri]|uniref:Reduced folate carrier,Major facilitator superfamily domain n=1 Tax=Cinara cedri TaxID=506608 RepID=A0A5E4M409_9HEMI|nr:Reduced folate carrier,Major facilitator superfamily domain [Cinara cedri]
MKNWKTVSLFVCVFAFVREFRPIEPFYSAYMTSPAINITLTQATREVYSVGAYSCFVLVIIVFLVTDYLRYKPVLIMDGICGMITYGSITGHHPSLLKMQIGQIVYGFFFSSEVASFGYLYAMTDDKRYFQRITGQARAACLFGKFFSSALAQTISLVNGSVPYIELVYLSIFGMFFSSVWAFIMPTVNKSVYFHNAELTDEPSTSAAAVPNYSSTSKVKTATVATVESQLPAKKKEDVETVEKVNDKTLGDVLRYLWRDFKRSYSDPYVRKLSLWWAVAFGGYVQVYTYINVLYTDIILNMDDTSHFTLFNGAAESMNTLLGGIAAYYIGKLELNWFRVGDSFLAAGSILVGLALLGCFYIRIIWFIYGFYICYGCLYQTMLTVAESEVAKRCGRESYGLVIGFNSFIALFIHTIITYGIIQGHFISVTTAQQFLIYSVYYSVLGLLFLFFAVKSYFSPSTDSATTIIAK